MLSVMERASTTEAQRIGDAGERLVAGRLETLGWLILARNVRVGRDELDLVSVDPGPPPALVVVVGRRRNRRDFGVAEETLDRRKRSALRRGVATFLERGVLPDGRAVPGLALRI